MPQNSEVFADSRSRLKTPIVALIIIIVLAVAAGGTYLLLRMSSAGGPSTSVSLKSDNLYAPSENTTMTGSQGGETYAILIKVTCCTAGRLLETV